MKKLAQKFSLPELQSIIVYLQTGDSISTLISGIENPDSTLLNPASRGKFRNMLPRLYALSAEEEQTLRTFATIFTTTNDTEIFTALQPFYADNKTK